MSKALDLIELLNKAAALIESKQTCPVTEKKFTPTTVDEYIDYLVSFCGLEVNVGSELAKMIEKDTRIKINKSTDLELLEAALKKLPVVKLKSYYTSMSEE